MRVCEDAKARENSASISKRTGRYVGPQPKSIISSDTISSDTCPDSLLAAVYIKKCPWEYRSTLRQLWVYIHNSCVDSELCLKLLCRLPELVNLTSCFPCKLLKQL